MRVLIVGAGAQAKLALDIFHLTGEHDVVGLLDLSPEERLRGSTILGAPVLGGLRLLDELEMEAAEGVLVACPSNRQKEELTRRAEARGWGLVRAVHPSAVVSPDASVGEGVLVQPLAVLQPLSSVGRGVVIQTGTLVSHDCVVEDFANVGPGATLAGHVRVGWGAYVYSGATITPGVSIGEHAKVGAGALVVRDVPAGATVVAVPARVTALEGTVGA